MHPIIPEYLVHLRQLVRHGRVAWPQGVSTVVNAKEMGNNKTGIFHLQLRNKAGNYSIVHCVQVLHVEGGIGKHLGKQLFIQARPRIVTQYCAVQPLAVYLVQQTVLQDFRTVEVAADLNKGGQSSRGQGLQSLQSGGRWVGEEAEQLGMLRLLLQQVFDDRQLVAVVRGRRVQGVVVNCEIVPEGINQQPNDSLEPCWVHATAVGIRWTRDKRLVVVQYRRLVGRVTLAAFVDLYTLKEEALAEQQYPCRVCQQDEQQNGPIPPFGGGHAHVTKWGFP